MTITVHEVLAGAYRGKDIRERALLTHASIDDGVTALCRNVKRHALCDEVVAGPPTCERCLKRWAVAMGHKWLTTP